MTSPNWPRFAEVTYSPDLHAAVMALGLEIPWQGRPRTYQAFPSDDAWAQAVPGERDGPASHFIIRKGGGAWFVTEPGQVRRELGLSGGTPSAKALDAWLTLWGWQSPAKSRPTVEPNDGTRIII